LSEPSLDEDGEEEHYEVMNRVSLSNSTSYRVIWAGCFICMRLYSIKDMSFKMFLKFQGGIGKVWSLRHKAFILLHHRVSKSLNYSREGRYT